MIRTTIFLHILFICLSTSAQDTPPSRTINYAYDANGNRIRRWVTVEEAPVPDTTGLLKNLAVVKTGTAGATGTETGRARLWPNPTPGKLELSIPWAGEHMPVEYGCYSLAGVELFRGKTGTVNTKIDISRYPPGSYVFVLFGKERDVVWKVVRYCGFEDVFHLFRTYGTIGNIAGPFRSYKACVPTAQETRTASDFQI